MKLLLSRQVLRLLAQALQNYQEILVLRRSYLEVRSRILRFTPEQNLLSRPLLNLTT
jgi:hypothetical protein